MKPASLLVFAAILSGTVTFGVLRGDAQEIGRQGPAQPGATEGSPDPARLEAARELVAVFSKDILSATVVQLTNQVWPPIEAALRSKNPNIDNATLVALRQEFVRIQTESLAGTLQDAAPIYARYFTTEELRAITAFYRSPVGAKVVDLMPRIMGESMAVISNRVQEIMTRSNEAFMKVLRQRGYAL